MFFYAWWRPFNLWIILPSIAVNYMLATTLVRMSAEGGRSRLKGIVLALGILFNVAPQTNVVDGDAGSFAAGTVTVTLPSLAPGASAVITFRVTVN